MKKIFFSLLTVVALSACGSDKPDYVLNDTAFCSGFDSKEQVVCVDKDNAKIDGRVVEYFSDGKTYRDFGVKNGVLHGKSKAFYENGKPKKEMNYKNGKIEGRSRTWYENGQLEIDDVIKDDITDRRVYTENGNLWIEMRFQNGKLNGQMKVFHKNGKVQVEQNYKDGKIEGPIKEYDDNGILIKEILKDEAVQTEYTYNKYGILVSKATYNDFKEIKREDISKDVIGNQCQKFIDFCSGEKSKKGCKTDAGRKKVVSKSKKGIQLENVPGIIIKTDKDYAVGDMYDPKTYVEYVRTNTYISLYNIGEKIQVHEFKETNIPICE